MRRAPFKDSVAPKVLAIIDAALTGAGRRALTRSAGSIWGDDPRSRYLLLAPTPSGLAVVNVRVSVPGEGPRAGGKVVRWQRVQLGELAVEIQGGHRLVTFQVEAQVLSGADAAADAISAFAQSLFAAVDGRPVPVAAKGRKAAPAKAGTANQGTGGDPRWHDDGGVPATGRREGVDLLIEAVIFDLDGVIVDSEIWWDEVRATSPPRMAGHGPATTRPP